MTAAATTLIEAGAGHDLDDSEREEVEFVSAEDPSPWRWSMKQPWFRSVGRQVSHAIYPVWRIGDLELIKPLVVTIEHGEGEVIISSASLRVWGAGDETYAALEDFQQTFRDVLESYEQTPPERMTRDAKQYLEQLRSYLPKA